MTFAERELEQRIKAQSAWLDSALKLGSAKAAREELDKLKALFAQRTPGAVRAMEEVKGLAR